MNLQDLDDFTSAYLECAFWSETDDYGCPLEDDYGPENLSPEALALMVDDCKNFQETNAELLALVPHPCGMAKGNCSSWEQNGHDFWLTRNGHGAGFWDRGYPDNLGDALTEAAKVYGKCTLYVGNDNQIYCA